MEITGASIKYRIIRMKFERPVISDIQNWNVFWLPLCRNGHQIVTNSPRDISDNSAVNPDCNCNHHI